MPVAALTALIGTIGMFISWAFITSRIKSGRSKGSQQARLMSRFFLCIGITGAIHFLPNLTLLSHPEHYPLAMAIAYTIDHIFAYAAFIYILKLNFTFFPRHANKAGAAVSGMVLLAVALTILNAVTMIWGTRPEYDADKHVVITNTHPLLSVGIIIMLLVSLIPAAILMIRNGFVRPAARTRSFLLGGGLLLFMVIPPLHDLAHAPITYLAADIAALFAIVIMTAGVAYRINEPITVSDARRMSAGGHAN